MEILSKETTKDIQQLIIARLKIFPSGKKISIGSKGDFTINELIDHVRSNDDIGKKITEIQLDYLQSLQTGELLNE